MTAIQVDATGRPRRVAEQRVVSLGAEVLLEEWHAFHCEYFLG